MELYILLECSNYDGEEVLGVYTSKEAAEDAAKIYADAEHPFYNWLEVMPIKADAEAERKYDREDIADSYRYGD